MKHNDANSTQQLFGELLQCVQNNDEQGFVDVHQRILNAMHDDLQQEIQQQHENDVAVQDRAVLLARGQRVLTSAEQKFYEGLAEAIVSKDPKQALQNISVIFPETIIEDVFTQLRTDHPLLSRIKFIPSGPITKIIVNTNGQQVAAWGELCDAITNELTAGFKAITTNLCKLSALLPVCKQAIKFSPAYLDRFVRETLYESIANGLEAGIVNGDGDDKPIGMTRQVGAGVSVVNNAYPRKSAVAVTEFTPKQLGSLIAIMAHDENGKKRKIRDLILLVDESDYYSYVFDATHIRDPYGEYRSTLPFGIELIPVSNGLSSGEAVLGVGYRYCATAGEDTDGVIDYSDHARFESDQRVYIVKTFANGLPLDNNAFQLLDISGLITPYYRVESVSITPSSNAKLQVLNVGGQTLTNAFDPDTTSYTLSTTHDDDVIVAVPQDAGATVEVKLGSTVKTNGEALTWAAGSNTLKVKVTAADGTTTKTYTVTVTKS